MALNYRCGALSLMRPVDYLYTPPPTLSCLTHTHTHIQSHTKREGGRERERGGTRHAVKNEKIQKRRGKKKRMLNKERKK